MTVLVNQLEINVKQVYKDAKGLTVSVRSGLVTDVVGVNPLVDADAHVYDFTDGDGKFLGMVIHQMGPIPAHGVNGVTTEAVLAMEIDRIKKLNDRFPCTENEQAIAHMEGALAILEERTARRIARDVEGKEIV